MHFISAILIAQRQRNDVQRHVHSHSTIYSDLHTTTRSRRGQRFPLRWLFEVRWPKSVRCSWHAEMHCARHAWQPTAPPRLFACLQDLMSFRDDFVQRLFNFSRQVTLLTEEREDQAVVECLWPAVFIIFSSTVCECVSDSYEKTSEQDHGEKPWRRKCDRSSSRWYPCGGSPARSGRGSERLWWVHFHTWWRIASHSGLPWPFHFSPLSVTECGVTKLRNHFVIFLLQTLVCPHSNFIYWCMMHYKGTENMIEILSPIATIGFLCSVLLKISLLSYNSRLCYCCCAVKIQHTSEEFMKLYKRLHKRSILKQQKYVLLALALGDCDNKDFQ